MNSRLKRAVWILNTIGLVVYMAWLYTMSGQDILRSQDGILFFLPCIPFFFVYMLLIPPKPQSGAPEEKTDDAAGRTEKQPPPAAR